MSLLADMLRLFRSRYRSISLVPVDIVGCIACFLVGSEALAREWRPQSGAGVIVLWPKRTDAEPDDALEDPPPQPRGHDDRQTGQDAEPPSSIDSLDANSPLESPPSQGDVNPPGPAVEPASQCRVG